jgi:hypothetical protein
VSGTFFEQQQFSKQVQIAACPWKPRWYCSVATCKTHACLREAGKY